MWKAGKEMGWVAWGNVPSLETLLTAQVWCARGVSAEKLPLPQLFLCALVYGSNSTLIFLWQFFMPGVWCSRREMLFDAITAPEPERAGTPDLNSKPTVRQMKAVTWIAAGSWVLPLLSVQDLGFAPWLDDITTNPAWGCLVGVLVVFFSVFLLLNCS